MLERLPAEILDEILFLASTPSTPTSPEHLAAKLKGYSNSYWVLADCCEVSKKVLARAQPLLWRNLVVRPCPSHSQVYGMLSKKPRGPTLASFVRKVRVCGVSTTLVHSVLRQTTNVEELVVDGEAMSGEFDLRGLRLLPNLAALTLVEVSLAPLLHPFRLDNVTSLSLTDIVIPSTKLAILLSQCLPSLRNLGIDYCYESKSRSSYYLPSVPSTILNRLEVLQCWNNRLTLPHSFSGNITTLRTIDSADDVEEIWTPCHLRYLPHPTHVVTLLVGEFENHIAETILALLDIVAGAFPLQPAPLSLHLPSFFRPNCSAEPSVTRPYINNLLSACAGVGVHVIWHDDNLNNFYDISPHFLRYAKELKAKRKKVEE